VAGQELIKYLADCTTTNFYHNEPINYYPKIIHEFAEGNGAYAFGYDDVCSNSGEIVVHNPDSKEITLVAF